MHGPIRRLVPIWATCLACAAPAQQFARPGLVSDLPVQDVRSMAPVDLNLDGVQDLAVVGADHFALLERTGRGLFREVARIPVASGTSRELILLTPDGLSTNSTDRFNFLYFGDDGSGLSTVIQCRTDGTGLATQSAQIPAPFGFSAFAPILWDNLDGDPELEVTWIGGDILDLVFPADLGTAGTVQITYQPPSGVVGAWDFDQDGDLDLLQVDASVPEATWLVNDGNGGFGSSLAPVQLGGDFTGWQDRYALGPIDTDGDPHGDLLITGRVFGQGPNGFQTLQTVRIYPGLPGGGFGFPITVTVTGLDVPGTPAFPEQWDNYVFQLAGSEAKDFAYLTSSNDYAVMRNNGDRTFSFVGLIPGSLYFDPHPSPKAMDIDDDPVLELAMGGDIWVLDRGAYVPLQLRVGPDGLADLARQGPDGRVVATADLDGDGDPDVVSEAGVRFNQGEGSLTPIPLALAQIWGVLDLDQDGDLDLLAGGTTDTAWIENLGDGTFGAPATPLPLEPERLRLAALGGAVAPPVLGDWDGDGFAEAFYPATGELLDTPLGGGALVWTPLAQPARDAVAVDVDGDGALDLVTSRGQLLLGNGVGAFVDGSGALPSLPGQGSTFPVQGSSAAAADLDGNGCMDLVLNGYLLMQDCLGSFQEVTAARTGGLPAATDADHVLVDADRDGAVDWHWIERTGGAQVLRNDGLGLFSPVDPGEPAGDTTDANTWTADFDLDGDPDLMVSGSRGAFPLTNLQGELAILDPVRLGKSSRIVVHDQGPLRSPLAVLGIAPPILQPIAMPEGRFWFDPGNLQIDAVLIPAGGAGFAVRTVPNLPGLLDTEWTAQAFLPIKQRLTNPVRFTIGP